jgi:adenylate kinase family enzyme
MRRVLVIGSPGAGKSTLSRQLAAKLGLPVVHLDKVFWGPGWTVPDRAAWRERVVRLVEEPEWIMDGNYGGTLDIRLPRADAVLWLDYPLGICLWRVLRRSVMDYGRRRADMAEGCVEQIDFGFFRYVWNFPSRQVPEIEEAVARHGDHLEATRLSNDRAASAFLAGLD